MNEIHCNQIWAYILLGASVVALIVGLVLWLWPYHWRSRRNSFKVALFALCFLISVLLLQTAYTVGMNDGSAAKKAADILSGTFQFFSLDADYGAMVQNGPFAFAGYGVYFYYVIFCFYTVIAPIAGGFFILQFLGSIHPRIRLMFNPKRTKFVFSELNERSVALAEDIARLAWQCRRWNRKKYPLEKESIDVDEIDWLKSVCIIFTDVYTDKESEVSSELLARAKRINAICLKDDILEKPFHWSNPFKKIVYFLIDTKEEDNLTAALSLLDERKKMWHSAIKAKRGGGVEMYVFTQNKEAERLIDDARRPYQDTTPHCFVRCINEYRNIVYKMFDDKKLLYGLIAKEIGDEPENQPENRDLYKVWTRYFKDNGEPDSPHTIRIVILGGGRIAKEYFKTAAWCCKMSSALQTNTVEKIEILVFAKNANSLAGELLAETGGFLSEDCFAEFIESEFPSVGFVKEFSDRLLSPDSLPTQRFLVAFGDDRLNYEAARWIRDRLGKRYGAFTADAPPAMIDFAIENEELFDALRREYRKKDGKSVMNGWCLMRPIGTIKECFSYANVRADDLEQRGMEADRVHSAKTTLYNKKDAWGFLNDYMRASSVAVAMHTLYKWFCRAVDSDGKTGSLYELMIRAKREEIGKYEGQVYWLEHRRWLTYMRTCGFRCPTAKEFVAMVYRDGDVVAGRHKDTSLRLHACMLEGNDRNPAIGELVEKFVHCHHGDLAAGIAELKAEIGIMKESAAADCALDVWLKKILLPNDAEADALDRLGLLMTLTESGAVDRLTAPVFPEEEKNKLHNFKAFDVDISRELYRQILRSRSAKLFEDWEKSAEGERANFCGGLQYPLTELVETYPEGFNGEIEIAKGKKYKLLLVPNGSNWIGLKGNREIRFRLKNTDWFLVAVSNSLYEKRK